MNMRNYTSLYHSSVWQNSSRKYPTLNTPNPPFLLQKMEGGVGGLKTLIRETSRRWVRIFSETTTRKSVICLRFWKQRLPSRTWYSDCFPVDHIQNTCTNWVDNSHGNKSYDWRLERGTEPCRWHHTQQSYTDWQSEENWHSCVDGQDLTKLSKQLDCSEA